MPANVVKPGEEPLWEKAKAKAKEQGKDENWPLINFIFQKMKKGTGKVASDARDKFKEGVQAGKREIFVDAGRLNQAKSIARSLVKSLVRDSVVIPRFLRDAGLDQNSALDSQGTRHFLFLADDLAYPFGLLYGLMEQTDQVGPTASLSKKASEDFLERFEAGVEGSKLTMPEDVGRKRKIAVMYWGKVKQGLDQLLEAFIADPFDNALEFFKFLDNVSDLAYLLGTLHGLAKKGSKQAAFGLSPQYLDKALKQGVVTGKKMRDASPGMAATQRKMGFDSLNEIIKSLPGYTSFLGHPKPKIPNALISTLTSFEDLAFRIGLLAGMGPAADPSGPAVGPTASLEVTAQGPYAMTQLLAFLEALQRLHWTFHWTAKGDSQFGDHLLFDQLYSQVGGEIDAAAEKTVAMYGPAAVDPMVRASLAMGWLSSWNSLDGADPIAIARNAEGALQALIVEVRVSLMNEAPGRLSLGLDNFLQGLADTHERHQYLLSQRATRTASVAARWLEKNNA